jgi:hypothetical protein
MRKYNWKSFEQSKRDFDCCPKYIDRDVDEAIRRISGPQPCQVQPKKTSTTLGQLNLTRLHLLEIQYRQKSSARSIRTRDRQNYRPRAISAYY